MWQSNRAFFIPPVLLIILAALGDQEASSRERPTLESLWIVNFADFVSEVMRWVM